MTEPKGPERTRKFMPKVKTGCFTCRCVIIRPSSFQFAEANIMTDGDV